MASKLAVLIGLNVLMDVLQKREPFFDASAGLLAAVETGQIDGYVAAHSVNLTPRSPFPRQEGEEKQRFAEI